MRSQKVSGKCINSNNNKYNKIEVFLCIIYLIENAMGYLWFNCPISLRMNKRRSKNKVYK